MSDPTDPTSVTPPPPPGASPPPPPASGGTPPPPPTTQAGGSDGPAGFTPPPPAGGGAAAGSGSGGDNKKPLMIGGGILAVLVLLVGGYLVFSGGDDGGSAVSSVDDVKLATVQILTDGSFVDPIEGQVQNAGAGTGFLIDESGIAVTNNHVVTGAASVQVRVGGEDEELDAEVLGISECSDLAVIDIEGDGYPVLEFADEDPEVGTDVFVAGFPLGDPEYTLTEGIISKAEAAVDTNWASVEGALETTAKINPGNSGGPLVLPNGQVVGVNYAANDQTDQNLSIKASLARDIIDRLEQGEDDEALGMNTQAVVSEDGSQSGVWVAAVSPGSVASEAGVEAGDLIVEMNGTTVGDDGTMGGYCDIISSAGTDGAIAVTVVRTPTGEVLSGEFNGQALEVEGSTGGPDTGPDDNGNSGSTSGETVLVTSDGGDIGAQVPVEWEVDTRPDGFNVAPDVDEFNSSFAAPGVSIRLIPGEGDPRGVIDAFLSEVGGDTCTETSTQDFDNGAYAGTEVVFECGGSEVGLTAATSGTGNTVLALIQASSQAEVDAGVGVISTVEEA